MAEINRVRIGTQTYMAGQLQSAVRALWQADAALRNCAVVLEHCSIEPDKAAGDIPTEFGVAEINAKDLYVVVTDANRAMQETTALRELMERVG